jgi:NAD(P)-dependent dehydrogenase (short-subunit alcohol dehydrogenase family)
MLCPRIGTLRNHVERGGALRDSYTDGGAILKDPRFMKWHDTEIPAGRLRDPEGVAGPATLLASRDADYVTGVLPFVDGGLLA